MQAHPDGFIIEQSTDGVNFAEVGRVLAESTGAKITNLSPGTTYWFRVRAFNTAGFSPYSNTANAMTQSTLSIGLSVSPPNPRVDDTITVKATAAGGTGSYLFTFDFGDGYRKKISQDTMAYSYGSPGLYVVAVSVEDGSGNIATARLDVIVRPIIVPPPAPSNLVATAVSTTEIGLSWIPNY